MTIRFRAAMTAAALLVLPFTPLAWAQSVQQSGYSDTELKTFAGIVTQVQRIADAYRPKLEAAQTVREQEKVEVAAEDEMTRAVTQEGMTVERYKEILKQTMSNPEVAGRVKQHIK